MFSQGFLPRVAFSTRKAWGAGFSRQCSPSTRNRRRALEQCILEIDDPRLERLADISPEQVNLALRRLLLKAQFRSCSPLSCLEGPGSQDECTKLQVWLELARLHVEGWPGVAGRGDLTQW
eukprot:symbB.v1.2.025719.t1/scaffold2509.1/size77380/6